MKQWNGTVVSKRFLGELIPELNFKRRSGKEKVVGQDGISSFSFFLSFFFFFFFVFLGLHPWHMEVSRLGVQSEL